MIVCIIVYNRFDNIKHWLKCWQQCEQHGAELIIIHNNYDDQNEQKKFQELCSQFNIQYVPRISPGLDISAFQDICRERLQGFNNDWDKMLWITDDVIPMSKDFLKLFITHMENPQVGVACMQISNEVRTHIRTTGFMIKKEVANKLTFPAEHITTKEECYSFEHRGLKNFYHQIITMGLKVIQVAPAEKSPLWDTEYKKRLNRQAEHDQVFNLPPKTNKVTFICTIFNTYPQIISSLILQTHTAWELILIHDGPNTSGLKEQINGETRVHYIETKARLGHFGHPLRKWALEQVKQGNIGADSDYICITNADNYHVPVYCEYLINGFQKNPDAVACYGSDMVHSYKAWQIIPCRLQVGFIDCAGVMVKKNIAAEAGWPNFDHSSDWVYFSNIIKKYGAHRFVSVPGVLIVHN